MTDLHRCGRLRRRFHFNVFNDITVNLCSTVPCRPDPADGGAVLSDLQHLNLLAGIGFTYRRGNKLSVLKWRVNGNVVVGSCFLAWLDTH